MTTETQNRNSFMDPFNFPMPSRKDLMSLSTINAERDLMKTTTSKFVSKRTASTNMTSNDIAGKLTKFEITLGAKPKLHGSRFETLTKPQWNLSNIDIERSGPRTLHVSLNNKPDRQMMTSDIKFAQPQCVKFTTKREHLDPLNPQYKIQSASFVDPPVGKFIRNT